MPTDTPPPPADAPQPTVQESAAAAREHMSAAALILEQARALGELSEMARVSELADTWERRIITAQQQIIAGALAILMGMNAAADLATEGRRQTQAATTSTIVMRGAWAILGLVVMVGGGWGVNVALDAAERRQQIEEKASARAAEALESSKPEAPALVPSGSSAAPGDLDTGNAGRPDEGVAGPAEGP